MERNGLSLWLKHQVCSVLAVSLIIPLEAVGCVGACELLRLKKALWRVLL